MATYYDESITEDFMNSLTFESGDIRRDLRLLLLTTSQNFYRRSFLLRDDMAFAYRKASYEFEDTAISLELDRDSDKAISPERMSVLMKALIASRYLAEIEWQEARAVHDKLLELLIGNAREQLVEASQVA